MIYYIIPGQIFTIFLSITNLTAITFPGKVQDFVGGQISDFKVYELNKGRTLVYEPKSKGLKRNLIIFLKDQKFHFDVVYNEKASNKDIEIRKGMPCNKLVLLKETTKFQLFNCPKSLLLINKSKRPLKVNGLTIIDKSYLSKGPPIYIDGKKIYYQGRVF